MSKLEVTKLIEARKLNKRTRLALAEPPVAIPYGAILSELVENREFLEFMYLGELYQCKAEVLRTASHTLEGESPFANSSSGAAAAPAAEPPKFMWQGIRTGGGIPTSRAKVPGGWLIAVGDGAARGVTFYPDADHTWDGTTL